MQTGNAGISLIKKFESCKLQAYKLSGEKYYTIGYGHSYDLSITATTVWTQAQADLALKNDLKRFENYVKHYVTNITLNQNQFDALVSYCYNRGPGGLKQLVNASKTVSDYSTNIVKYWGTSIKYKTGLLRRRNEEKKLFDTPVKGTLSIDEIAKEVIAGKWGTGNARKVALINAGYNYSEVQSKVNELLHN